jgi:hypothetical protein
MECQAALANSTQQHEARSEALEGYLARQHDYWCGTMQQLGLLAWRHQTGRKVWSHQCGSRIGSVTALQSSCYDW